MTQHLEIKYCSYVQTYSIFSIMDFSKKYTKSLLENKNLFETYLRLTIFYFSSESHFKKKKTRHFATLTTLRHITSPKNVTTLKNITSQISITLYACTLFLAKSRYYCLCCKVTCRSDGSVPKWRVPFKNLLLQKCLSFPFFFLNNKTSF